MDELKRLNNNQYAYLRQLPIDKLLELLDVAPVPTSCPEDEAYVDALEEAIIEKENENPTGFFPNVDQQWEQFVTHYLPDLEDTTLELEHTEHAVSAQTNQQSFEVPPRRVFRFSRVWRIALAACTLAIMVTAQAAGADVFGAVARWTKDVFSFGTIPSNSEVTENLGGEMGKNEIKIPDPEWEFASLQEALDAYGITAVHEPSWLPEGYVLEELDVTNQSNSPFVAFSAVYANGDDGIGITIMNYEGEPTVVVQKTDDPVETMEANGITFYLMENTSSDTVAWYDDQYEYYISGNLSKDILWKTAISMYDG